MATLLRIFQWRFVEGCLKPDSIPQKDGDFTFPATYWIIFQSISIYFNHISIIFQSYFNHISIIFQSISIYFNLFQSISYDVASMRSTFLSLDSYAPFFLSSRLSTWEGAVCQSAGSESGEVQNGEISHDQSIQSIIDQFSIPDQYPRSHRSRSLFTLGEFWSFWGEEGPRSPVPGPAVQVLIAGLVLFSSFISSITGSMSQLRNMKADKSKQPLGVEWSVQEPWMVARCNKM